MHLKFDLAGVRTHDLWIMYSKFHVPETLYHLGSVLGKVSVALSSCSMY